MNRELKAVLEVYTRKIRTFIDTQISRINTNLRVAYEHLVSRTSKYPVNYDIADRTIWDSEHLLTAITAFSARKISNGSAPNDGIPDGISLAHLLCSTDAANAVTKIHDDNPAWIYNRNNYVQTLCSIFPYMTKVSLNCKQINARFWQSQNGIESKSLEVYVYGCEKITSALFPTDNSGDRGFPNIKLHIYGLTNGANISSNIPHMYEVGELYFHDFEKGTIGFGGSGMYWMNTVLTYLYVGCKGKKTDTAIMSIAYGTDNVKDAEIREGACQNITFSGFNGLTAENMYNHILCKLRQDVAGCGDGCTITIGTSNLEKLEAVEEYNTKLTELEDTYGYTFA